MSASVLEHVLNCPSLPTLPGVAVRLLELTSRPDVKLKDIAKTVQHDQALSAKILRTVNSSYYGLSKPCPSIPRALTFMGLNTVKSLVLGFSLVDTLQVGDGVALGGFDLVDHWRRSMYGATGARLIAKHAGVCDPDEAFMSAMLQDVGVIACALTVENRYQEALARSKGDHDQLLDAEQRFLGVTHQEIGAALARKWRLPDSIIAGIEFHHCIENAPPEFENLVRCVDAANLMTAIVSSENGSRLISELITKTKPLGEFDAELIRTMISDLIRGGHELSKLFDVDTGAKANIAQLLADANERLIAHQLDLDRRNLELQENNERLAREAGTDPLTGAFNRKHFDSALQEAFEIALVSREPLSVLFVDADRFKHVNDVHGHLAGDRVLVEIVRRAKEVLREGASIHRYGGEEFVIMLPRVDADGAFHCAERVRGAIEEAAFVVADGAESNLALAVTVSCGVASFVPGKTPSYGSATKLIQAADSAVYQAKRDGRNCVRSDSASRSARNPSAPQRAGAPSALPQAWDTSLKVLLVAADPHAVSLVKGPLGGISGIDVMVASDGREALELLRAPSQTRVDLVLCDGDTGAGPIDALVRDLRNSDRLNLTPIVVLGSAEEAHADRALNSGANAVVPKSRLTGDPHRRVLQIVQFWCLARAA